MMIGWIRAAAPLRASETAQNKHARATPACWSCGQEVGHELGQREMQEEALARRIKKRFSIFLHKDFRKRLPPSTTTQEPTQKRKQF
jgi:hypothetical protein